MKKRILFYILLALTFVSVGNAQRMSNMFTMVNSNSLIKREKIFIDLQNNIEKVVGETKPGLRVDVFYNRMSEYRNHLLEYIPQLGKKVDNSDEIEFLSKSKDTIYIRILNQVGRVYIDPEVHFAVIEAALTEKLTKELKSKITSKLNEFTYDSKEVQEVVNKNFVAIMKKQAGLDYSVFGGDYSIEDVLVTIIMKNLQNSLKHHFSGVSFKDLNVIKFNEIAKEINAKIMQSVNDALNDIEQKINEAIDDISTFFVNANAGVAVTNGTGALSGGLHLSANLCREIQFGAYFNDQFAPKADSGEMVNPKRTLAGLNLKCRSSDVFQFEGFASYLFGDGQYQSSLEGGLSSTYKPKDWGVTFSLAYFLAFLDTKNAQLQYENLHSVGLIIEKTDSKLPKFMIGVTSSTTTRPSIDFQLIQSF